MSLRQQGRFPLNTFFAVSQVITCHFVQYCILKLIIDKFIFRIYVNNRIAFEK